MPMTDVAFAAGFASVRQFNDTVREVFASVADRAAHRTGSPSALADRDGVAGLDHADAARPRRRSSSVPLFGFLGIAGGAGRRELGRQHVPAHAAPATRRRASSRSRPAPSARVVHARRSPTLGRPADRGAALPAAARPRRRSGRDRRPPRLATTSLGPLVARGPVSARRAPSTASSCSSGRSSASRCRSPAHGRSQPASPRPSASEPRATPARVTTATAPDVAVPFAGRPARARSRSRCRCRRSRRTALRAACAAIVDGRLVDRRAAPTGQVLDRAAAGASRHRAVDGQLRGDARARRPGCVPADRPRRASRARPARPAERPEGRRRSAERWRPWRSYALHHLWATL